MSETPDNVPQIEEHKLVAERRRKLQELRAEGQAFPNDFRRDTLAQTLHTKYDSINKEELAELKIRVNVAGRMMAKRIMGKASFTQVQDMSGSIQLFVQRDSLAEGLYQKFKTWDIGDIISGSGILFKTKTDELSIKVDDVRILTKSLHPLPEKFHGLANTEMRYRQRYLDLIINQESRNIFIIRTKIIQYIRDFLNKKGFLEAETPMMHSIPGGATARPFATHHNALGMDMYLRIAPELYLKRLVVGGFERVYEINRNFRNEGLSTRHNPEFTMVEWYMAYADFNDLMDMTEKMLRGIAEDITGSNIVKYQGDEYDFAKPFARMTVLESILHYNPNINLKQLDNIESATEIAIDLGIKLKDTYGLGKIQIEIFEKTVEDKLMHPTFITEYPAEVSPLARRNDDNPFITDRFEFFVGGREVANGFSEINDYEDQAQRFHDQVAEKDAGDDEAMHFDQDYITALEYAMPPTAGEGIGIDRLVMLFTDSASIRDVLLFPQMRTTK